MRDKRQLFTDGHSHILQWCTLNNVIPPRVEESGDPELFGTCAYYRDGVIHISVKACAAIGVAGPTWSYPGYCVDRTPYGVLAHELGHHVDEAEGTRGGRYSKDWFVEICGGNIDQAVRYAEEIQRNSAVEPISGYHDNVLEWFAEMFRLFVTNPNLLLCLRPALHAKMARQWPVQAEERYWPTVLAGSQRHVRAAENKITVAQKAFSRQRNLL